MGTRAVRRPPTPPFPPLSPVCVTQAGFRRAEPAWLAESGLSGGKGQGRAGLWGAAAGSAASAARWLGGVGGVGAGVAPGRHEPVAHVAHGADLLLELRPELGPQPPHVDVDRPGASVVVVPPHLLQQLRPGEDPPRVLREVLQQLELLVGQVEGAAAHLRRVRRLVDDDVPGPDLRRQVVLGLVGHQRAPDRQPQPGLDLGRSGGGQQDVVRTPLGRDGCEPALGDHEQHGGRDPGRAHQPAQRAGRREVASSVDQHDVGGWRLDQGARLGRQHPDLVGQQAQGGQHLGAGRQVVRQQQQSRHERALLPAWGGPGGAGGARRPGARPLGVGRHWPTPAE